MKKLRTCLKVFSWIIVFVGMLIISCATTETFITGLLFIIAGIGLQNYKFAKNEGK